MKNLNHKKGNKMAKSITVSLIASIALIGGMGLSGCTSNEATTSTVTIEQHEVMQSVNLTGRVSVDAARATASATQGVYSVVAYNLNDSTEYKTLTDSTGSYALSGMTEGEYQIVASNSGYAIATAVRKTMSRGTAAVVNITLTAAGSIKGTAVGAGLVSIPGTSYISTVAPDGSYELINVPVGEYTLNFGLNAITEGYTNINKTVSIVAGANTVDPVNVYALNVQQYDNTWGTVLGMHYGDGYEFSFNRSVSVEQLSGAITLSDGKDTYPVKIDAMDLYTNYVNVHSEDLLPAGDYTLTLSKDIGLSEDVVVTLTLNNTAVVWSDTYEQERSMGIQFATDTNLSAENITVSGDDGSAVSVLIHEGENKNGYILSGDYKSGVNYTVALSGLATTELFYPTDYGVKTYVSFYAAKANIQAYGIEPGDTISTYFNSNDVDLGSVSITLTNSDTGISKTFDVKDPLVDVRSTAYYNYYYGSYVYVDLKPVLKYAENYTMTVNATNVYGEDMSSTTTFSTPVPIFTDISPDMQDGLDLGMLAYGDQMYSSMFSASFNVKMNTNKGTATLTDITNSDTVDTMGSFYMSDSEYGAMPASLKPSTSYELTFSGFEAVDGTAIPDKTTTFKTPTSSIVFSSIQNAQIVDPEMINNQITFSIFGMLDGEQKATLEGLVGITQYGEAIGVNETHPTPKFIWRDLPTGFTMLTIAFTIEDDSNYEIKLSDPQAIPEMILPYTMLSFSTLKPKETVVENTLRSFSIIGNAYISNSIYAPIGAYYDEPMYTNDAQSNVNVSMRVPYLTTTNSSECSSNSPVIDTETYAGMVSVSESDGTVVDINATASDNGSSYEYYYYDANGNYIGTHYLCYTDVYVSGSFAEDYNTTYTLAVDTTSEDFTNVVSPQNTTSSYTYSVAPYGTVYVNAYGNSMDGVIQMSISSNVALSVEEMKNSLVVNTDDNLSVLDFYVSGYPYVDIDENNISTEYSRSFGVTLSQSNYSYTKYEVSSPAGISSYDVKNATVGAKVLTSPISGVFQSVPDLTPMTVLGAESESVANDMIVIALNKPVYLKDIATFDTNGTPSDVAFELMDDANASVTITDVKLSDGSMLADMNASSSFVFTLAEAMDVTKEYTLTLKSGSKLTSPVSKLTLSGPVALPVMTKVIEIAQPMYLYQYYGMKDQNVDLGVSGYVSSYAGSNYFTATKITATSGYMINQEDVTSLFSGTYQTDSGYDAYFEGDYAIQKNQSYSSIDATIAVSATDSSDKTVTAMKTFDKLYRSYVPSISSVYTNGTDANVQLQMYNFDSYSTDVNESNFKVYNYDANTSLFTTEVSGAISSVTHTSGSSSVYVDINTSVLDANSSYGVRMMGVPYYGTEYPSDFTQDSFIFGGIVETTTANPTDIPL
ncbi:hypothetical protein GJV85_01885 [Sulfurimonas aquatica]|uniref:Carboxypeptidase regulatory-like domain-containing protein n=1 Tax=Sulfurimonas aquatica TaxID=2672570 RepID=A0A975GBX3_9BACT|nr:carboxypeptidase-like regulatory domain-containing protein [Sulfurimonas aquatica]QSZ40912.1 hypothetical protein GJV85_01885 [Sulfurimonas aquatica]